MERDHYSISKLLKFIGCLLFDIAIIIAFLKAFALFSILAPVKSILMLIVLLIGLAAVNCAVLLSDVLFKKVGIAYSAASISLLITYAFVANILSVYLIKGNVIWYIVWELIILSVLIALFSIIVFYSGRVSENIRRAEIEQISKSQINIQLMNIENAIMARQNDEDILPIINSFKALKERINASTPFGRITGNSAVLDIENKIKKNLEYLHSKLESTLTEESMAEIKKLLDDTRRLVINREALNVR